MKWTKDRVFNKPYNIIRLVLTLVMVCIWHFTTKAPISIIIVAAVLYYSLLTIVTVLIDLVIFYIFVRRRK